MPDIIQVAKERADAYGVKNILVATAGTGNTAKRVLRVFGPEYNIFAVGTPPSSYEEGICMNPGISEEKRKELEELGIKSAIHDYSLNMKIMVNVEEEIADISKDALPKNSTLSELVKGAIAGKRGVVSSIIGHVFMWFGEAGKVCLEIAFMAADSGAIPLDRPCVAIATPVDAGVPHVAMVLHPAVSENLFTWYFGIADVASVPQYTPLIVSDLGRSFRFYRDLVGLEAVSGDENGQYAEFRVGPGKLALAEVDALPTVAENTSLSVTPQSRGKQEIRFEVDDVQAISDRLMKAGYGNEKRITTFKDPDGNVVHIMPH